MALTETDVVAMLRIEASRRGAYLWRNNSGAACDSTGRVIRYGLGNDSPLVSARLKSSDLIGIDVDGRFLAVECKRPGWRPHGGAHEAAQRAFLDLVRSLGGRAWFSTGGWHEG